jgi:hypothetical protein
LRSPSRWGTSSAPLGLPPQPPYTSRSRNHEEKSLVPYSKHQLGLAENKLKTRKPRPKAHVSSKKANQHHKSKNPFSFVALRILDWLESQIPAICFDTTWKTGLVTREGEWMGADKNSSPRTRPIPQNHFQKPRHEVAKVT